MPTKEKHLIQYKKNKSLANSDILQERENNGWKVTIIFYAVLHLLESSYADKQIHTTTHVKRKKFLDSTHKYRNIQYVYENLEMLSHKSRYECVPIKDKHVRDAIENMETIEEFIKKIQAS